MIELIEATRVYGVGDVKVAALKGVTVSIPENQFCAVTGPSGSGKSTFLHLVGGLDYPTSGEVMLGGKSTSAMDDNELTLFRRRNIGFVFQFFNLLPTLTAVENVCLPAVLDGKPLGKMTERSKKLLAMVGLEKRANHKPDEMSGGEMQRVAIARALIADPPIILADEPTGNLDSTASGEILSFLRKCVDSMGKTVVMVTHDKEAADVADRQVALRDGQIESDTGA